MSNIPNYERRYGEAESKYRGIREQIQARLPELQRVMDSLESDLEQDPEANTTEGRDILSRLTKLRAAVTQIK